MKKLFIGFRIPRKIIDIISMLRSTFEKDEKYYNWVSGNNLHMTLLFLGSQSPEAIENILTISKKTLLDFGCFFIKIKGTGVFSKKQGNQILWLSINDGKEKLEKINYELKIELEKNINLDLTSKFTPHISIARKKYIYIDNKIDVNKFMNSVYFPIEFHVKFFTLFESVVINNKVHYKKIDTFHLT